MLLTIVVASGTMDKRHTMSISDGWLAARIAPFFWNASGFLTSMRTRPSEVTTLTKSPNQRFTTRLARLFFSSGVPPAILSQGVRKKPKTIPPRPKSAKAKAVKARRKGRSARRRKACMETAFIMGASSRLQVCWFLPKCAPHGGQNA